MKMRFAELREVPVGAQRPSQTSDESERFTLWKNSQYRRSSRATRKTGMGMQWQRRTDGVRPGAEHFW